MVQSISQLDEPGVICSWEQQQGAEVMQPAHATSDEHEPQANTWNLPPRIATSPPAEHIDTPPPSQLPRPQLLSQVLCNGLEFSLQDAHSGIRSFHFCVHPVVITSVSFGANA